MLKGFTVNFFRDRELERMKSGLFVIFSSYQVLRTPASPRTPRSVHPSRPGARSDSNTKHRGSMRRSGVTNEKGQPVGSDPSIYTIWETKKISSISTEKW